MVTPGDSHGLTQRQMNPISYNEYVFIQICGYGVLALVTRMPTDREARWPSQVRWRRTK